MLPADSLSYDLNLSESRPIQAALVRFDAESSPAYDMHYGVEVGVVLSGRVRRMYQGWETKIEAGQVWYCGIWEPHGWEVLRAPCEHLVLVLLPDFLVNTGLLTDLKLDLLTPFRVAPELRPQVSPPTRQKVLSLAGQLVAKLGASPTERAVWSRLLTLELLVMMQQDWAMSADGPKDSPRSLETLVGAVEIVLRSRRPVTVAEAAEAASMSVSHFSRTFREVTGISFAKFALRHRLGQAALQLLRTRDPIKAVAADWGFANDSHLHRCFLSYYGCSPGEYRERRHRRSAPMVLRRRR